MGLLRIQGIFGLFGDWNCYSLDNIIMIRGDTLYLIDKWFRNCFGFTILRIVIIILI